MKKVGNRSNCCILGLCYHYKRDNNRVCRNTIQFFSCDCSFNKCLKLEYDIILITSS